MTRLSRLQFRSCGFAVNGDLDRASLNLPGRGGRLRGQQGQALLECILVLALLTIAAIWGASQWQGRAAQTRIRAMATWMLAIEKAIGQDTDFMTASGDKSFADLIGAGRTGKEMTSRDLVRSLKDASRLPASFTEAPPMPYDLRLILVDSGACAERRLCARELLLVLKPTAEMSQDDVQWQALDLLAALEGKGAVVLEHSANVMRGASIHLGNPMPGHDVLPVGSVGLMLWRSGHEAPYVGLNESRQVTLGGSVTFDGDAVINRPLKANAGLVLANKVRNDDACHPSGMLATLHDGSLVICKSGRWVNQDAQKGRSFKACRQLSSGMGLGQALFEFVSPFPGANYPGGFCECQDGQVPRYLGVGLTTFQGVPVQGGFVCES